MVRILVTGGAGFIGSHLCEALVKKGHKVTILDNLSGGALDNIAKIAKKVKVIKGDIRDKAVVSEAMKRIEYVVHLAAIGASAASPSVPNAIYSVNVDGAKVVLDEALRNRVKKVILGSSYVVYGNAEPPLNEERECKPHSQYGESKLINESDAQKYLRKYRLPTVCLRYFSVYGPRQSAEAEPNSVFKFIKALQENKPLVITGDGTQTRDFIYIADAVDATIAALKNDKCTGHVINIGTGTETVINDIARTVAGLMKREFAPAYEPKIAPEPMHLRADPTRLNKILKFKPKYSLLKGLKETIRCLSK